MMAMYLSILMQHRCKIEAVLAKTSHEFQKSQTHGLNSHLPLICIDALNVIANKATKISAQASDTTNQFVVTRNLLCLQTDNITRLLPQISPTIMPVMINILPTFKKLSNKLVLSVWLRFEPSVTFDRSCVHLELVEVIDPLLTCEVSYGSELLETVAR